MLTALFSLVWWLLTSLLGWIFSPVPLALIAAICGFAYYFITKDYDYWPSRGVPGPKPKFPWGTKFGSLFQMDLRKYHDWLYYEQGGKKYCGFMELHRPVLYVGDLDMIRSITIKDFEHFTDHRVLVLTRGFEKAVSLLNGQEWKTTRSAMTPAFSASKLRGMHQLCLDNADNLSKYMLEEMETKSEIELKDAFGRFTMDNIASCAFGFTCNSFTDPNCEFAKKASEVFKPPPPIQGVRLFLALTLGLNAADLLPDPAEPVARFFFSVVRKTRELRETTGDKRNDFLQLLLDTKDKEGNRLLTDESITAQGVLFFIVGYDTTASLLSFAAYCMATEPEWQRRVQEEIDTALERHDGKMTYEAVSEMSLLDNVLWETLRLYPPAAAIERECSKDYTFPGTDLKITKGTLVQMPVMPLHRNPDLFPEPLKFDPDRFLPSAKEARHPCAFMPFGSGPRNCIAMRFALFEAKVALAAVLKRCRLEPGPSTPPPPMPLAEDGFLTAPKKGCGYIRVVPRD